MKAESTQIPQKLAARLKFVYCKLYRNIPGYCCQRRAFLSLLSLHWSFCLCCRMGKALCERQFALHRQQLEKDKQNIDVATPGEISADAHVCGFHYDAIDEGT